MGWIYLVGDQLDAMNVDRGRQGRRPLVWGDVQKLTGISAGLLRNLENNSELKATNTRFLGSLCRLFACGSDDLIRMVPGRPEEPDHGRNDDLLKSGQKPNYHIDVLYGEGAQRWWRENRDGFRPPIRSRS
jgi:hypothetical protein